MAVNIIIKRTTKTIETNDVIRLFEDYINDSFSGKRTKPNGQKVTKSTIRNYEIVLSNLIRFKDETGFDLKLHIAKNLNARETKQAKAYYLKFYKQFTSYLYDKRNCFDNYVGFCIKHLRTFFNYLIVERGIDIGSFYKNYYCPSEEIQIITLSEEQLKFLIHDEEFNSKIIGTEYEKIRDIFVFGCTVALRVSDILSLTKKNILQKSGDFYINVKSQKTNTSTSIKIPNYAIDIIQKYKGKQKTLLPAISVPWFNKQLKELSSLIPDNYEVVKTRERRGKQVVVYKDPRSKTHYKLSDHITSHTMRRTAITTMLNLGMPEHLVRKISGHAANSKEFFRYVQLSQAFIDEQTDRVFDILNQR